MEIQDEGFKMGREFKELRRYGAIGLVWFFHIKQQRKITQIPLLQNFTHIFLRC